MSDKTMTNESRNSSISVRSSSIETTVTKLLMSTKHLLQVLTQWSKGSTSGKGVSDAYVQLGNDFKLVSKHFVHHGVDVSDLGNVPLVLRKVLELALRERPSDETLNKYLPQIREIIVNLLDKLKVKQNTLKEIKKNQQHLKNGSISSDFSLSSPASNSKTLLNTISPRNSTLSNNIDVIPNVCLDGDRNFEKPDESVSNDSEITNAKDLSNIKSDSTENDPVSQLKTKHVQRRASKRYSAYHMAKLTNQSASDAMAASNLPKSQISNDIKEPERTDTINKNLNPLKEPSIQHVLEDNNNDNNISPDSSSNVNQLNESHLNSHEKEVIGVPLDNNIPNFVSDDQKDHHITIFLKYKGRTKKYVTPMITSMNTLRLFFVEKFAYSPGSVSFPDIHIMDPKYSVFYELDEQNLKDIKDGSIIQLDLENQFENAEKSISDIGIKLEDLILKAQNEILQSLTDKIKPNQYHDNVFVKKQKKNLEIKGYDGLDIENIKCQLALLKKTYKANKLRVEEHLEDIVTKMRDIKMNSIESNFNINDTYIEKSQNELGCISDSLLSKVDDLQDIIEILRKDVADRGAKPTKKKLESLIKEIKEAGTDLNNMENFINIEKPTWKKLWESQLDKVCEEQQFLTLQEDLIEDLRDDLSRTNETFELIKLCCEEKEKNPTRHGTNPPFLPLLKPGTFNQVREQMLLDVQSLTPNHEGRLDALEKAEKLWEKEKKYKNEDAFRDELGNFVENSSLKKSGGVEELERLRRHKDEENLRNNFGRKT